MQRARKPKEQPRVDDLSVVVVCCALICLAASWGACCACARTRRHTDRRTDTHRQTDTHREALHWRTRTKFTSSHTCPLADILLPKLEVVSSFCAPLQADHCRSPARPVSGHLPRRFLSVASGEENCLTSSAIVLQCFPLHQTGGHVGSLVSCRLFSRMSLTETPEMNGRLASLLLSVPVNSGKGRGKGRGRGIAKRQERMSEDFWLTQSHTTARHWASQQVDQKSARAAIKAARSSEMVAQWCRCSWSGDTIGFKHTTTYQVDSEPNRSPSISTNQSIQKIGR